MLSGNQVITQLNRKKFTIGALVGRGSCDVRDSTARKHQAKSEGIAVDP
jgi:hypothetical protein